MLTLPAAVRAALTAAIWRRFDLAEVGVRAGHLVVSAGAMIAALIFGEWAWSGDDGTFDLYGVNSAVATVAAGFALLALLVSRPVKGAEILVVLCLGVIGALVLAAIGLALDWLPADEPAAMASWLGWTKVALLPASLVWLTLAVRKVFISAEDRRGGHPLLRAAAFSAGSLLVTVALPSAPTFTDSDFDRRTANLWEFASTFREPDKAAERQEAERQDRWASVELAQPNLVMSALDRLAPRTGDQANLFTLGVAGWSSQDVFLSEIRGALDILGNRFGHERQMALVNHRSTSRTTPLATATNLAAALGGIAARMDRERDVLVLVLTSHGNTSGFALEFAPTIRRMVSPASLKTALDAAGIRNRIVLVSACYSGVFVPALADENSVVITASSATTNSFGCSNERDWTYFGDAFFNQSLRDGGTLVEAFARARNLVAEWEARDGVTPSRPQIHIGSAIQAKLPAIIGVPDPSISEPSR